MTLELPHPNIELSPRSSPGPEAVVELAKWIQENFDFLSQLFPLQRGELANVPALFSPGDYKLTGRTAAPAGWFICEGQAISRTTYKALFVQFGVTYGPGDGATTFNLPDFRGRVLAGLGTHADVNELKDNDGLAVGARTPKHTHEKGTLATAPDGVNVVAVGAGAFGVTTNAHFHAVTGATASNGPAYGVVNVMVKT